MICRISIARNSVSEIIYKEDIETYSMFRDAIIYLDINPLGNIYFADEKKNQLPYSVLQHMPIAGDVQSKNIELCSYVLDGSNSAAFQLRVLKDIVQGGEAEIWFSDDILAKLGMPFLTPFNIKGRKNYVCHQCNVQFEKPNPLKLHIFLGCKTFTPKTFWRIFLQRIIDQTQPLNLTVIERPRSQENTCSSDSTKNFRCISEPPPFSAFRPYASHFTQQNNNFTQLDHRLPYSHISIATSLIDMNKKRINDMTNSLQEVSLANAVEIETFATNWGKSREGHVCLYCGRIYSRKYGLKIHIRTHTGYKPLQCKYCLRPFGDPSNLNKHVRLHVQCEMPYSCHMCGKTLVRKRDLERHIKTRHCNASPCEGLSPR